MVLTKPYKKGLNIMNQLLLDTNLIPVSRQIELKRKPLKLKFNSKPKDFHKENRKLFIERKKVIKDNRQFYLMIKESNKISVIDSFSYTELNELRIELDYYLYNFRKELDI